MSPFLFFKTIVKVVCKMQIFEKKKVNDENSFRVKETRSIWCEIYEWIDCAVITVICLLLLFTFIFRQVEIVGSSMEPTLYEGNRVIVSDAFYTPEYGDVVVISGEVYESEPIIKRIIALENQYVDIKDGFVYVGDSLDKMQPVSQEFIGDVYTSITVGNYEGHKYPLQVPKNCVFVMGDNRSISLDSRTKVIGVVDSRHIIGKAIFKLSPFGKIDK